MRESFEWAAGSVAGVRHTRQTKRQNNQDHFVVNHLPGRVVAVVTDGCSSSLHSDVGAKIGALLVAKAVDELSGDIMGRGYMLDRIPNRNLLYGNLTHRLTVYLRELSSGLSDNTEQFALDYLMFGCLVVLITPSISFGFHLGDGYFVLNGETIRIGPYPGNRPPYIGYRLLHNPGYRERDLWFRESFALKTSELNNVIAATDGLEYLIRHQHDLLPSPPNQVYIPNQDPESVGPLSKLWEDDSYFQNPDALRRFLIRCNFEPGLLPDDTTIVSIRKKECGS